MSTIVPEPPDGSTAPRPSWTDLFGLDPDYTGGACSVDYVRYQRDYSRDEMKHERCAQLLFGDE